MGNGSPFIRKKILIVSKRQNVSDFFRLEAESCACPVKVVTELPFECSEFDVILVDMHGEYIIPESLADRIYIVSDDGDTDIPSHKISYPTLVDHIRCLYEGYSYVSNSDGAETNDEVIYVSDRDEKYVIYKNQKILLTDGERRVLLRLGQADGAPVSREELKRCLGAEEGNITDVYVCRLRRKLELPFETRIIRTVRGKGYSLIAKIQNINDQKRRNL